MKALCWEGKKNVRIHEVSDPWLMNPRDAIVEVTTSAICGSDLHLYDGVIPTMRRGDILGHEFVGRVVAVGPGVTNLKPGDRVVVPFAIACGDCWFCTHGQYSLCDNSNPNAWISEKIYGRPSAGLFGYSHMMGGYAGGQAEFVRVPYADVGPLKLPDELPDDKAIFLADVLPTAWMAAENCDIHEGDTVAVWGCGPVGLLAIQCAYALGAAHVIAIDSIPKRLELARANLEADVLDFDEVDVLEAIDELTGGRGPDACIDAVGMEASGHGASGLYDRAKHAVRLESDRPTALREAIRACRKGGTISIPGVYGGYVDKFPLGAAFGKGLTVRGGQTHVHRYMQPLLERILSGQLDPSFVVTHRMPLELAPECYDVFARRSEDCVKVLLEA
ncbi:glutathione-dependent formaldehyde dehydrogenase [Myxococcota bacterium]|nr:glutathione-dependent formaldehyde dehydrogenase [Myxococcota bacterium]